MSDYKCFKSVSSTTMCNMRISLHKMQFSFHTIILMKFLILKISLSLSFKFSYFVYKIHTHKNCNSSLLYRILCFTYFMSHFGLHFQFRLVRYSFLRHVVKIVFFLISFLHAFFFPLYFLSSLFHPF